MSDWETLEILPEEDRDEIVEKARTALHNLVEDAITAVEEGMFEAEADKKAKIGFEILDRVGVRTPTTDIVVPQFNPGDVRTETIREAFAGMASAFLERTIPDPPSPSEERDVTETKTNQKPQKRGRAKTEGIANQIAEDSSE